MRARSTLLALSIALSIPVISRADILFIDMNNSPEEIAAAQRAAAARGEKLIVRPQYDEQWTARIADVTKSLRMATITSSRACKDPNQPDACAASKEALKAANKSYEKLTKSAPRFGPKTLKRDLLALKAEGANLSSVILSGHDGNGWFGGVLGDIYDKDIDAAFKAARPLGDSIRSVVPWGCYTTAVGGVEYRWKKLFPNATMVAGFDGSAPSQTRPANWRSLESVLVKEKELTEARDNETIKKVFEGIPHWNEMTTSICLNGETMVSSRAGVTTIKEEMAKCKAMQKENREKVYQCYMKAEKSCPDVPASTQRSNLRSYYNHLQHTEHCDDALVEMGHERPLPDEVIRLIFDKQVRTNFENIHKNELAKLNALMDQMGLPAGLRLKNLGEITRRQFLDIVEGLKKEALKRTNALKDRNGQLDDEPTLALRYAIPELNKLFNYECVPDNWIESGSRTASSCGMKQGLANVFTNARKRAEFVRRKREREGI